MRKGILIGLMMLWAWAVCSAQATGSRPAGQQADSLKQQADSLKQEAGSLPAPAAKMTLADSLIAYAKTFMGKPYKLGAEGPAYYDCSSFVRAAFRGIGIEIPRNTINQIKEGDGVINPQELKRGDIVLFGKREGVREVGHVGIVVDVDLEHCNFRFIHCGVSNGVEIQRYSHPYYLMRYLTGRRILPE